MGRPVPESVSRLKVEVRGAGFRTITDSLRKGDDNVFRLNRRMTPEE